METDTDFPTLFVDEAEPGAERTVITITKPAEVDLAKVDLQAVALAHFRPARDAIKAATEKLTGVVHDLSTPTKLADAKSLRFRLIGTPRAEARKTSTALKSRLTQVSTAVGDELKAIEADFEKAEALITPQIEAREAEIAEEKRIAAEKEAARQQKHRDNLAKLAEPAERCLQPDMTAERIANGIKAVEGIVIDPKAWEEFAARAEEQKVVTLERMRVLHGQAVAREEAAARAAAEKLEAERKAAELKAEADRLAAERAELERQRAEIQAEKDRIAAEAQAKADEAARVEREAAEYQARIEADARAAADLLEAALKQRDQQITEAQDSLQVLKAEAETPDATARETPAIASPSVGSMGAGQAADAAPVAAMTTPSHTNYTRTLRLGEIQSRIAPLSITAEGLAQLGFPAHVERGLKLYWPGDFPAICRAISEHALALASAPQQLAA